MKKRGGRLTPLVTRVGAAFPLKDIQTYPPRKMAVLFAAISVEDMYSSLFPASKDHNLNVLVNGEHTFVYHINDKRFTPRCRFGWLPLMFRYRMTCGVFAFEGTASSP